MDRKWRRLAAICLLLSVLFTGCGREAREAEYVPTLPVPSPSPTPEPICTVTWHGSAYTGGFIGTLGSDGVPESGTFDGVNSLGEKLRFEGVFSGGSPHRGTVEADRAIVSFEGLDCRGPYSGDIRNGIPEGEGVFSAVNGEGVPFTYTGLWAEGQMHGAGALIYEAENYIDRIGTFTHGRFTPTGLEALCSLGTRESEFTLSDEQIRLIAQYPEIWAGWNTNLNFFESPYDGLEQGRLTVYKCLQDPENIPADWMVIYAMRLLDARNITISDDITVCRITAVADGYYDKIVQILLPERLDSFRRGARMHVYGIPLAVSSYTTVLGEAQPCLVVLAGDLYMGY